MAGEFVRTVAEWGLTIRLEKTKLLTMGRQLQLTDGLPVQLDTAKIDTVDDFTYLGSTITSYTVKWS